MCDNVKIAFKNKNNVGKLFSKLKDKQSIGDSRNVVYQVNCKDCPKCYIGTSGQKLSKRMAQHNTDAENKRTNKSALAFHATHQNHKFDFDGVKVLEHENIYRKRMFLEKLHIKANQKCVNKKSIESRNVSDIYMNVFKKHPPP